MLNKEVIVVMSEGLYQGCLAELDRSNEVCTLENAIMLSGTYERLDADRLINLDTIKLDGDYCLLDKVIVLGVSEVLQCCELGTKAWKEFKAEL